MSDMYHGLHQPRKIYNINLAKERDIKVIIEITTIECVVSISGSVSGYCLGWTHAFQGLRSSNSDGKQQLARHSSQFKLELQQASTSVIPQCCGFHKNNL